MRPGFQSAAFLAAVVLVAQVAPARSQGFLQQLFGLGSPSPPPQSAPAPLMTPGGRPYVMPGAAGYGNFMSRRPRSGDEDDHDQKSASYRTICVRMCDGFYFPISNNVSKKGLYRDGMRCRAQCGDDARVFYLSAKTLDVDGAVDLQGRQYGRLNTAYIYRKTLVAGCQCKPDPWSEAELARHQRYADAEQDTKIATVVKSGTATDVATDGEAPTDQQAAVSEETKRIAEAISAAKAKNPWRTTTTSARTAPKPQVPSPVAQRPASQQASAPGGLFGGGMGLGGGQMTWPGDAPRRP